MARTIKISLFFVIILALASSAFPFSFKDVIDELTDKRTEYQKQLDEKKKQLESQQSNDKQKAGKLNAHKRYEDKIRAKKEKEQKEALKLAAEKERNSIDITTVKTEYKPINNIINPYKPFTFGDTYIEVIAKLYEMGVEIIDEKPVSDYKKVVINKTTFESWERVLLDDQSEPFKYKGQTISYSRYSNTIKASPIKILGVNYQAEFDFRCIDKDYSIWLLENKKDLIQKMTIDGELRYAPAGLYEIKFKIPHGSIDETTRQVHYDKLKSELQKKYGKWEFDKGSSSNWFRAKRKGTYILLNKSEFTYSGDDYLDTINNGVYEKYIESNLDNSSNDSL